MMFRRQGFQLIGAALFFLINTIGESSAHGPEKTLGNPDKIPQVIYRDLMGSANPGLS